MNQNRQDFLPLEITAALLARPDRALDDGIDDLEVRRIEGQRDVDVTARRFHVGREALVVLDVARALQLVEVVVAFELFEQLFRRLAQDVHQHIDAATMRHADDDLVNSGFATLLNQVVQHRDQALAALEREAFLTDVTRVQVTLDALCAGELVEYPESLLARQHVGARTFFESLAYPETLARA